MDTFSRSESGDLIASLVSLRMLKEGRNGANSTRPRPRVVRKRDIGVGLRSRLPWVTGRSSRNVPTY